MKQSSFNLSKQNQKVESRIVAALERISEAFRVLLWNESKDNSLSPIQIQLLIFMLFHSREKCRVSYLAEEFNMTKATISDSVRVLLTKKLVTKESDLTDTRSYTISLTPYGSEIAEKASFFATSIEKPIKKLTEEQKQVMLSALLKLIYELNKSGVITIQRMCFTCIYYEASKSKHYCNLLKTKLAETEIRMDCPEHELIT
jgi:DNA-binding MarR family transcriptional regulator